MPRYDKTTCMICNELYTNANIGTHIADCIDNLVIEDDNVNYLLKINDEENVYWMYIIMHGNLKLSDLDKFLKKTWLECCGHLSKFSINNIDYENYENNNMNCKIKDILDEDLTFGYEYDFGSTTELFISVVKIFNSKNNKIKIISRNSKPKYKCATCKKFNSEMICFECQKIFCKNCSLNKKHKCDPENSVFDLINSPRMADCFYMSGAFMDND